MFLRKARQWWVRWCERRREEKHLREHGFVLWCPGCKSVLLGEWAAYEGNAVYSYCCARCRHESRWTFGAAPVPLLISPRPEPEHQEGQEE